MIGLLASEVKLALGKRKQQSEDGAISWQAGFASPEPSIRSTGLVWGHNL